MTSTKDPMNLSQRQQRENDSKRNNGPHESCLVFAVSFTQKSEAATFPRISVRISGGLKRTQQALAQADILGLEGPSPNPHTS